MSSHPTHDALRRRLLAGTALGAGSLALPGANGRSSRDVARA